MNGLNVLRIFMTLLVSFLLFHSTIVSANLGARPAYVYVDLDKRNPSGTFTITNMSDKKQVYRAKATHFVVKPNGSVFPQAVDEYSLAKWIKFNPKEFSLPPKSSREVRFTIIRKKNIEQREYWGAIQFVPLQGTKYTQNDGEGREVSVQMLTNLLIPIYGSMDGTVHTGAIDKLSGEFIDDRLSLSATINNTGEGGLRLQGEWTVLEKTSGKEVLTQAISPFLVLPKQKRNLTILSADKIIPGNYIFRVQLTERDFDVLLSGQEEIEVR